MSRSHVISHVSHVTFTCQVSGVMCPVSHVTCCMLRVTCHLSLTPTATAIDPPPANSTIMHSRLVRKDPKTGTNFKKQETIGTSKTRNFKRYANNSNTLFDQKSPVHRKAGFLWRHTHTDSQTHNWWTLQLRGWISPEGKISENLCNHLFLSNNINIVWIQFLPYPNILHN